MLGQQDLNHQDLQINNKYRYWRVRTFYSIYIGYVLYYFTRKSFTFAIPSFIQDFNYTKGDIGKLLSIWAITYGISKFTSGILSDRSNPRYFMSLGLLLTSLVNLAFSVSTGFGLFTFFMALNGWFQGWGWPPCTKQLTHWFGRTERGVWWSLCSSSHNIGGWGIALIAAYIAQHWGWQAAMVIPAILCILGSIFLVERLRDTPQSLNLPPIEVYKKEVTLTDLHNANAVQNNTPLKPLTILFKHVLVNKNIWYLSAAYFFVYIIRSAINDWGTVYLVDVKGYQPKIAGLIISWFELGGLLGTILAGCMSDWFFKGNRIPVMFIFACGLFLVVPGLWYNSLNLVWLDSLLIGMVGFLIFGPQMLVGLSAAEFVDKKAVGTSNGFVGLSGYLGAAMAGFPLGYVIDTWLWKGFFGVLAICIVGIIATLIPVALNLRNKLQSEGQNLENFAQVEAQVINEEKYTPPSKHKSV